LTLYLGGEFAEGVIMAPRALKIKGRLNITGA